MRHELFFDANAGIIDCKGHSRLAVFDSALVDDHLHFSAGWSEFDSVRDDVDQHLLQLHGIADIVIFCKTGQYGLVVDAFLFCLFITDGVDPVDNLFKRNFFPLDDDLAAFNPAHIQYIVNQR